MYYVDVPLFILTTGSEPVKVAINQEKSEIIAGTKNNEEIYKAVKFAVLNKIKQKISVVHMHQKNQLIYSQIL